MTWNRKGKVSLFSSVALALMPGFPGARRGAAFRPTNAEPENTPRPARAQRPRGRLLPWPPRPGFQDSENRAGLSRGSPPFLLSQREAAHGEPAAPPSSVPCSGPGASAVPLAPPTAAPTVHPSASRTAGICQEAEAVQCDALLVPTRTPRLTVLRMIGF